jgi:hypothetical protein
VTGKIMGSVSGGGAVIRVVEISEVQSLDMRNLKGAQQSLFEEIF